MRYLIFLGVFAAGCNGSSSNTTTPQKTSPASTTTTAVAPVASAPVAAAPVVTAAPVIPTWTAAAAVASQQVTISGVSPASQTINTVYGSEITLNFTVNDPLNSHTCYWLQIIPVQTGYASAVTSSFGNGLCNAVTYSQTGSVSTNYILVVDNGVSNATYEWDFAWHSTAPATVVSASPQSPSIANTVLVYNTQMFTVTTSDTGGNGACAWTVDGNQVSTDCVQYNYTQTDSNQHTIVFTIIDGSQYGTVTWGVQPAAQLTSVTPSLANVATGGSQLFVATASDPNSSGYLCQWELDGSLAQTRGSCSYNYVRQNATPHVITVDLVYDSQGDLANNAPATVYADPAALQAPSITGVSTPTGVTSYYTVGQTTAVFGVTSYSDPSGGAEFVWTINGVVVNCNTSSICTNTGGSLNNGIELQNYNGTHYNIQVSLTNGQYSSTASWMVNTPTDTINETIIPGTICHAAGTTFTIFGSGFESTDVFTLQNQNLTLIPVAITPTYVQLKLPSGVSPALQGVKALKTNSNSFTTPLNWVNITSGC
jgi:hypothetical protein